MNSDVIEKVREIINDLGPFLSETIGDVSDFWKQISEGDFNKSLFLTVLVNGLTKAEGYVDFRGLSKERIIAVADSIVDTFLSVVSSVNLISNDSLPEGHVSLQELDSMSEEDVKSYVQGLLQREDVNEES